MDNINKLIWLIIFKIKHLFVIRNQDFHSESKEVQTQNRRTNCVQYVWIRNTMNYIISEDMIITENPHFVIPMSDLHKHLQWTLKPVDEMLLGNRIFTVSKYHPTVLLLIANRKRIFTLERSYSPHLYQITWYLLNPEARY